MDFPMKPGMAGLEQRVDAQLGLRPSKLDWLVYRLFRWRWRPLLQKDPSLFGRLEQLYLLRQLDGYHFSSPEQCGARAAAAENAKHEGARA